MNKFKYLKISKNKQIRYLDNNYKEKTYIVFLHGFMSDIEGKNLGLFLNMQKKIILAFLLLNILAMENHLVNLQKEILVSGLKMYKPQLKE